MTKFLLALIAAAAVLIPMSKAEAGGYRYHRGYYGHHHHRPVVVVRDNCYRPYGGYYGGYYAPRPVYYSTGYCAPVSRVYVSRPRFAFSFGF